MNSKESCLIIAGEKSGEDHSMTFMPELMSRKNDCEFYGVGGDRLNALGVELLYHLRDFSGIGISEVLSKIPFYFKALDLILREVDRRNTKSAILVDFQGFNLKLAKKLKKRGVKVFYYVAPQAWVWKPWRAKTLEENVHTLFTILPFEKKWFQDRGVSKVRGVVHPLMLEYKDSLENIKLKKYRDFETQGTRILILPGSRNTEVCGLLPIFMKAITILKEEGYKVELGIVKTESVKPHHYDIAGDVAHTWNASELTKAFDWCDMSVAASGTVTLATGLFCVPTVVCYKISLFSEFVLGMLVPYKGPISLTNIVHENMLYPELIQHHCDRYNIAKHLRVWIKNKNEYNKLTAELIETKSKLTGEDFSVSEYIASVTGGGK
jgi:lipid-A-disaccharide synthase